MNDLLEAAGISVISFAATNIDDIFVLMAYFSDRKFRPKEVVSGQYAGILALVLASLCLAALAVALTPGFVRYLGLLPIFFGLRALWALRKIEDDSEDHAAAKDTSFGRILAVAAVTFANGGDNIGVYTPLFSTRPPEQVTAIVVGFLVMTGVWCLIGHFLVSHPLLKRPVAKYGRYALPIVLIGIGTAILLEK